MGNAIGDARDEAILKIIESQVILKEVCDKLGIPDFEN